MLDWLLLTVYIALQPQSGMYNADEGIGRAVLIIFRQLTTTPTDVYDPTTVRLLNFRAKDLY